MEDKKYTRIKPKANVFAVCLDQDENFKPTTSVENRRGHGTMVVGKFRLGDLPLSLSTRIGRRLGLPLHLFVKNVDGRTLTGLQVDAGE